MLCCATTQRIIAAAKSLPRAEQRKLTFAVKFAPRPATTDLDPRLAEVIHSASLRSDSCPALDTLWHQDAATAHLEDPSRTRTPRPVTTSICSPLLIRPYGAVGSLKNVPTGFMSSVIQNTGSCRHSCGRMSFSHRTSRISDPCCCGFRIRWSKSPAQR